MSDSNKWQRYGLDESIKVIRLRNLHWMRKRDTLRKCVNHDFLRSSNNDEASKFLLGEAE